MWTPVSFSFNSELSYYVFRFADFIGSLNVIENVPRDKLVCENLYFKGKRQKIRKIVIINSKLAAPSN